MTHAALRRSTLLLLSSAMLALCLSSSAGAATYSVYTCEGPNAAPVPNAAWLSSVADPLQTLLFNFGPTCGALSVDASTTASYAHGDGAEYVFDAPSGTTISGYSVTRRAAIDFAGPTGAAASAGVRETTGVARVDRDCDAAVTDCAVPSGMLAGSGLALTSLSVGVHCSAPSGCPAGGFSQLAAALASARVDVEDPYSPSVVSVAGSLPGSLSVAGVKSVDVTTTDVGGGVARVELLIDGGAPQAVSPGGNCATPYTLRQPCPSGTLAQFSIDTSTLTNGTHAAQVRAVDAAGNVSASANFTFSVAAGGISEGVSAPNNGLPAVEQPIVRSMRSVITAPIGSSAVVEGTLTTAAGEPIVGASLDVTSTDLGVFNSPTRASGSVTTTSGGAFSVRVTPSGAQRIEVIFRPTANSLGTAVTSVVVREELSLTARAGKKRVRPGGQLRMSGRLSGAGGAARGTPVEIDVKIGKRWRAVDVVTANGKGSFRWNYRFTRVRKPTRFNFRAIVRKNSSWPWPTTTSRQVSVVVAR